MYVCIKHTNNHESQVRISPPPPPSLPLASGASFRLAERGEEKEGDSA